jgi:Guanylate-kinase-associated protein (GKAP) protein
MGPLTSRATAGETHPLTSAAQLLLGTGFGRILTLVILLAIGCAFSPFLRALCRPVWRLVTGGLIFTEMSPWHSTWLRPAPERPEARPNFRGESYPITSWGRMAGWQRMLIRWACVVYVVAYIRWPLMTFIVSIVVGVTIVVLRILREVAEWAHDRTVGIFAQGAAIVLDRKDDPLTWIAVPRLRLSWVPIVVTPHIVDMFSRWPSMQHRVISLFRLMPWIDRLAIPILGIPLEDDEARILVQLDAKVTNKAVVQEVGRLGTARLPDGPWESVHHESKLLLEFKHPKRPPTHCDYSADVFNAYPVDEVPIGQRAGGSWATLPLKKLTPHGLMSATTGWCKTSTANVYVAHTAGNGGKVFINDPKRVGYTHFNKLENVVIRVTAEGWAETLDIFITEMERRYALIERFPQMKENPELYFQPWFLVNDERGSYISDLRDWAKRQGEKGMPLPLRHEKKILWQGRAAAMYEADLAQQGNLNVFIDSDGRDQRMWRIASGPQSVSAWRMLFSGVAKMRLGMRKGRAVLGIGVDTVEEIQLAQLPDSEARAFAEVGTQVAERENKARIERIAELLEGEDKDTDALPSTGETAANVRPADADSGTSERGSKDDQEKPRRIVPGQRAATPESVTEEMSDDGQPSQDETPDNVLDLRDSASPEPAVIVGIKAASDLLGMEEAAFTKARQRRPIPGEFRTGIQPSWPELELREWRSQAPRAGGAA